MFRAMPSFSPITDLTLTLHDGIDGVDFEQKFTVSKDGWNARTLHLYSHIGTHMDAPYHFEASDETIAQIPLDRCQGKAWIVRISDVASKALIEVDDFGDVATKLQAGDSLLIQTLWSQYFGKPKFRDEMPRISVGLAKWCVEKKVRMLGVEAPSVADVHNLAEVTEVHHILLGGDVIIVEGLTNLDRVAEDVVQFWAIPLKLKDGDGSPCRAFCSPLSP